MRVSFKQGSPREFKIPLPTLEVKPNCQKKLITTVLVNNKASTKEWLGIKGNSLVVKPTKE